MNQPQPPRQSKTILGRVTQAVQTIQAKVNFSQLKINPKARVPELRVQDSAATQADVYPLLGDRYVLGRSSKSCDIVVRNPVVSQVHLSLSRTGKRQKQFLLKDEGSTNGVYRGRRRLTSLELRHGDLLTLGPPELADAVKIQFHNPPPWYILLFRYGLYGAGGFVGLLTLAILSEWTKVSVTPLPPPILSPIIINDKNGRPLQQRPTQAHIEFTRLSDFSPYLPKAVIASEDSRFYWHLGFDPYGTTRAVVSTVRRRGKQGGSTITQQVSRTIFRDYVGREDNIARKIKELIVSLKLETFYSKDQIMLAYLNRAYLGIGATGFEDAARLYFNKSAKDLDIKESATLVAILPAPNAFNPIKDYKTAFGLRNRIIERMLAQGAITPKEADAARRSIIEVSPKARELLTLSNTKAPYFYSYVFSELRQLLSEDLVEEGNFIVETGLDIDAQRKAETSLRRTINNAGGSARFSQGGLVTLNSSTGEIIALVGGLDYQQSEFNRVTQAKRQPGSTFKIFTYTSAIEQGISSGRAYSCAPLFWKGQQYKGCERTGGSSTDIATGVALSENAIALRVAQDVGLDKVVEMARRMGVKSNLNPVPGLVLGQSETTVLEMTGAFGVLANRGVYKRPHAIKRILDSSNCQDFKKPETCRVIYSFDTSTDPDVNRRVLNSDVADTMTDLFQGVVRRGTGRSASLGLGEAGKTGTTNDNKDLWFIGYIPSRQLVTGVWLGNDNSTSTSGSSAQAATLWGNYMRQLGQ